MTNILPGTGLVLGMILMVSLPRQVAWKIGLVVLYLVGMGMGLFIFGAEFVCSEYRSCM